VALLDWLVVFVYLAAMLIVAAWLGRRQSSREDYFLGGNKLSAWSLAVSTMATQCSTNSLLGAPAFVGFVAGGGLLWLQYELAVPLAMLLLIPLLVRVRMSGSISIYAFLEERLGRGARLAASATFLFFRGIATGVTVYGVAIVVTLLVDVSYTQAVLLLMGVTIAYDLMGGMRAVVISDVIQLLLIVITVLVSLIAIVGSLDGGISGPDGLFALVDYQRLQALDFSFGLNGEGNYGFWPMLVGGLFLYMAYYGCDQSQAQRVLSSKNAAEAERVLRLNGLLRFPVVLLYCLLGLALAAFAANHPEFVAGLPTNAAQEANFNLVFPVYVLNTFPTGLVGLVMVGIFAAAMSSIDSSLNALAAATVEDHIKPRVSAQHDSFIAAKAATLVWGVVAVVFSYQVEAIAPTVLEAINKVGSMSNGSLLALFTLALLAPGVGQRAALSGFGLGLAANMCLWLWAPQVSWLWWNLVGFVVALLSAGLLGVLFKQASLTAVTYRASKFSQGSLVAMAIGIFLVCLVFGSAAQG